MIEREQHIASCLHPLRVRNKFTNEMVTVPCGKCEACTTKKAFRMVQRLDMERLSWKYNLFITLTYDNDHLPLLQYQNGYLVDLSPKRVHPIKGVLNINLDEELHRIHRFNNKDISDTQKFISLCTSHYGGVPYLSTVDVQRFMKRLRQKININFKNATIYGDYKNSPSIRYFCGLEYGPTTFRPHCHMSLFFSSDWLAAHIEQFIRECWQFGFVDTSFVSDTNSDYVAGYINSVAHLPVIYQIREIRPSSLYSKHPALGSLSYSTQALKSQFLSCDVTQCFLYTTEKLPLSVPLWRSFEDSLYPKLPYFSQLSPVHRNKLYSICQSTKFLDSDRTFQCFYNIVTSSKLDYIKSYIDKMRSVDGKFIDKVYRWYSVSNRVLLQSEIFDISVKQYIETIEKFYVSKDYHTLKRQFDFEQKYSQEHNICQLIGLDKQFIDSLFSAILSGCDFSDLDATEQLYLKQFEKLDLDCLFNDDLDVRYSYMYMLDFEFSDEFLLFKDEKMRIYENSSKTKKKNDYLTAQTDSFYNDIQIF